MRILKKVQWNKIDLLEDEEDAEVQLAEKKVPPKLKPKVQMDESEEEEEEEEEEEVEEVKKISKKKKNKAKSLESAIDEDDLMLSKTVEIKSDSEDEDE